MNNIKKFKCPYCPKSYQSKNDLVKHAKRIHGLSIATLKKLSEEEKTDFMAQCLAIMNKMDKVDIKTIEYLYQIKG